MSQNELDFTRWLLTAILGPFGFWLARSTGKYAARQAKTAVDSYVDERISGKIAENVNRNRDETVEAVGVMLSDKFKEHEINAFGRIEGIDKRINRLEESDQEKFARLSDIDRQIALIIAELRDIADSLRPGMKSSPAVGMETQDSPASVLNP